MKIIIHGGFFSESSQSNDIKKKKQESLKNIVLKAYDYLKSNNSLDTVIYAVKLLENDPLFNAGLGSQIQRDGEIRLSASLMDSKTNKFSGVINVKDIKNPILLAKKLREEEDNVLSDEGANSYAKKNGFSHYNSETKERRNDYNLNLKSSGTGTVGCVALDSERVISAATSTGGKGFELPGRVSDSATVAGNYANKHCGVSCTGVGEDIVSAALASKIVTRVSDGMTLKKSFEKSFRELEEFDGFAGAIAIDSTGEIYYDESHPKIVFSSFDGENLVVFN
ncbi:MAG: isoaspartyl peptidase/L-asparaginase [Crocinitomicaceae bacterium]|nr:isoaspartyl peptidase/L-asparaginase [Crocinitomicaceae bacterium]